MKGLGFIRKTYATININALTSQLKKNNIINTDLVKWLSS